MDLVPWPPALLVIPVRASWVNRVIASLGANMICVEDIGHLLPNHKSGKIVGIASYRGDYIVVACEHRLYKLWDDGIELHVSPDPTSGNPK